MSAPVYDVTTWPGAPVSPYTDIGAVINSIIADIKANQTTQTTRPGGVIYIPPGHYNLLTRVVVDVSFLQIKGSGHGFLSEAIRDQSNTNSSQWVETLPGSSHIQVKNTDGNAEAFLVQRSGSPATVGRLNSVEFRDFCIDGVASSRPFLPGNGKIGISVQSDNDSFRMEGMGMVYLAHGLINKGADAPNITNNFIAECGSCIELTGSSQVAKVTNNFLISAWAGMSVYAQNAEGLLLNGNSILWAPNVTLDGATRCSISGNKFVSYFPGLVTLQNGSSENLMTGNHFRRELGDGVSNGKDDLFGLIHLNGNGNAVTGNQFSVSLPTSAVTPSGAKLTIILVGGGDSNYLATNQIVSNVPSAIVLDASSTNTKILYSGQSGQLQPYSSSYAFVPTP